MKFSKLVYCSAALAFSLLQTAYSFEDISLPITDLEVVKGKVSTKNLKPLLIQDQSGTQNTSGKFIEFIPSRKSSTIFYFQVPKKYKSDSLHDLKFVTNFKGRDRNSQEWTFKIWDGANWIEIGHNEFVTRDAWSRLEFSNAITKKYINSYNEISILFETTSSEASAKLDYVNIVLNPSDVTEPIPEPTPTPTPVPEPTPTPTPTPEPEPTPAPGDWWRPVIGEKWTIQYTGTLVQKSEYMIYNLDLYDTPQTLIASLKNQGKSIICYFSGGSWENWREDANDFPSEVLGNGLDGWPGEKWLDVRALTKLRPIMQKRVDLAKAKGCDAVDVDNMDGYTNNSGFPLSYTHQLAYNKMIAEIAHQSGLAVGLKNDLDQIPDLVDYFDFAVNEQCYQYNECNTLLPFINQGKPVYHIEYEVRPSNFCPKANATGFDSLYKKLNLDGWVDPCWNY